jgi:hypothetical protein
MRASWSHILELYPYLPAFIPFIFNTNLICMIQNTSFMLAAGMIDEYYGLIYERAPRLAKAQIPYPAFTLSSVPAFRLTLCLFQGSEKTGFFPEKCGALQVSGFLRFFALNQ